MKKLVAIALVLVMALTMTYSAFAERAFILTYITDAEGIEQEVEELPFLVFVIDDENMTCIYSTIEGDEEGTIEILERDFGSDENGIPPHVILQATLVGGDVIVMTVYNDQIEILDEENNMCYILQSMDSLAALAEAE